MRSRSVSVRMKISQRCQYFSDSVALTNEKLVGSRGSFCAYTSLKICKVFEILDLWLLYDFCTLL